MTYMRLSDNCHMIFQTHILEESMSKISSRQRLIAFWRTRRSCRHLKMRHCQLLWLCCNVRLMKISLANNLIQWWPQPHVMGLLLHKMVHRRILLMMDQFLAKQQTMTSTSATLPPTTLPHHQRHRWRKRVNDTKCYFQHCFCVGINRHV